MSVASSNSSAISTDDVSTSHSFKGVMAQLLPIAVSIIIVNGVVFLLFAKEKRLRTPRNYLLLSLAVCDFMTGLINVPLIVIVFSTPPDFILGFFVAALHYLVVVLVAYHIFAITAERYFSIVYPFRHRWKMTKKSSLKIVGAIWTAAAVIAFLPVAWWFPRFRVNSPQNNIATVTRQIQTGHTVFCIVFVFLVPYVLIVYSQVVMFKTIRIRRKTRRVGRKNYADSSVARKAKDIKRCLIIFAFMAFLFAICWFPWFVISFFQGLWFPIGEDAKFIVEDFSRAFLILKYLTSIFNPLLYTFLKRDFLDAFKAIILRRKIQPRNGETPTVRLEVLTPHRTENSKCTRADSSTAMEEDVIEYITVL
ncbi:neuromedin-U receptor 2-like [Orbicella faveolata]|uniref:neuromedin-U receptor 2-like n=1 Tax=Orbicella faveolata TaxID=48498 RepID=UPI0009E47E73|nr:neuromedin-U receptor 2-like [Orbicella faveolata]